MKVLKSSKQLDEDTLFTEVRKCLRFNPDISILKERADSLTTKCYLWKVDW